MSWKSPTLLLIWRHPEKDSRANMEESGKAFISRLARIAPVSLLATAL